MDTTAPAIARNYRDVEDMLTNRQPFRHSTCSALMVPKGGRVRHSYENTTRTDGFIADINDAAEAADVFVFFSYGTPVAYAVGDGARVTSEKFTTTTSKHMGIFRRVYNLPAK